MVPHLSTQACTSILIVDDDAMVREVTAGMLSDAGYDVHEAIDGVDAMDFLQGHAIDLVITDINMPRMDGSELRERIRTHWPKTPVLLVSGRPRPPGTDAFMAKPFGWTALIEAVGRVCPDLARPH